MKRRAKKGAPISRADAFDRHQRAIEEKDDAMPEAMRAMLSPQELRAVERSKEDTPMKKAERVLTRYFNLAATGAENELKPLMQAALANLRKHFDVEWVEEMMGMTVIHFNGRHEGCSSGLFDPKRDADDKHHCTEEAFEVLEDFKELTSLVGDYRTTFCLYGRLT